MIELSVIRDLVAIFGVIAGFSYYVLTVRHNQRNQEIMIKNQELQLETRQAQLYMSLLSRWNTAEFSRQRYDSYNMEWTDLDDFREKYNRRNNSDIFASWNTFGRTILGLAELKRKGLINMSFLDGMMLADILHWWTRFGSLEKESWERGSPNWWSVVPFIMEVIEYDRKNTPENYDENGVFRRLRGKPWINPDEMRELRNQLIKKMVK
jgi:hypothetical protein